MIKVKCVSENGEFVAAKFATREEAVNYVEDNNYCLLDNEGNLLGLLYI